MVRLIVFATLAFSFALVCLPGCGTTTYDLRKEAAYAFDRGEYRTAAELYAEVLERRPQDEDAHLQLGRTLLADGRYLRARTHLEIAYQQSLPNLARSFGVAGELADATALGGDLDRLFAFLRERAEVIGAQRDYLRWGDYAAKYGDPDSAVIAYRTAARVTEGKSVEPYLRLADLYESLGDTESASTRLRQAYGIDYDDPRVIERLQRYVDVVGPTIALTPDY